ncbi:MAG: BCCT family transporter [Actinomycetota bacterium]|nr:BCCT family transporter [Actinomycetota bacterium]
MRDTVHSYLHEHTNPPVFIVSAVVILTFVAAGVLFTEAVATAATAAQDFITTYFGWFYILAVSLFLIFVAGLLFTRFGNVRLGPDDSRPQFSTLAWFAMLFTAGMGIGLVYFGVAEPISHFTSPPVGQAGTEAAASRAMNLTFFHWGLHPWAVYIVLGLSLAYFSFRRGLPLKPASAFHPLLGEGINGPVGHLIDVLAVFGTVFGLATSLGIGAQQINAGLNSLFGIPMGTGTQVMLVASITAVAVVSVLLGIDRGIRRLALINMCLALALTAFVFFFGPTLFILDSLPGHVGYYLQNLPTTSFRLFALDNTAQAWQADWTLFYWGWWISWSPFVGVFIARISYGRTVRHFILGSLFAPVGASIIWFTVFGGTAIFSEMFGPGGVADAASSNALFVLLQQLPVSGVLSVTASVVAIVVVVLFFATSSDSGSLVVDMLTNGGDPDPIWQQRLFWAVLEGVVAAVLLVVGGLAALQTASIAAGLPFAVVLCVMCYGLWRGLQEEAAPVVAPGAAGQAPEGGRREPARSQGARAPGM